MLDDFMQFQCSTPKCGRTAIIKLTLPHYRVLYACVMCEKAMRRRYLEAEIVRLDAISHQGAILNLDF